MLTLLILISLVVSKANAKSLTNDKPTCIMVGFEAIDINSMELTPEMFWTDDIWNALLHTSTRKKINELYPDIMTVTDEKKEALKISLQAEADSMKDLVLEKLVKTNKFRFKEPSEKQNSEQLFDTDFIIKGKVLSVVKLSNIDKRSNMSFGKLESLKDGFKVEIEMSIIKVSTGQTIWKNTAAGESWRKSSVKTIPMTPFGFAKNVDAVAKDVYRKYINRSSKFYADAMQNAADLIVNSVVEDINSKKLVLSIN